MEDSLPSLSRAATRARPSLPLPSKAALAEVAVAESSASSKAEEVLVEETSSEEDLPLAEAALAALAVVAALAEEVVAGSEERLVADLASKRPPLPRAKSLALPGLPASSSS